MNYDTLEIIYIVNGTEIKNPTDSLVIKNGGM